MPSEKTILLSFARGDLQAAVARLQVTVTDRRRIDALVAGLLKDRATPFATLLNSFAAPALKLACEALEITPEGRGKAAYVTALAASVPQKKSKAQPAAKEAPAKAKRASAPTQAAKPRAAAKAAPTAKAGPKAGSKAALKAGPTKSAVVPPANQKAHQVAQQMPTVAAKARVQVAKAAKAVQAVEEAKAAKAPAPKLKDQSAKPAPKAKAPKAAPALVAEVLKQDGAPVSQAAATEPAVAAEPAKKAATPRRGPLSWSEAAQMAAHRGQSAASMLRAPAPQSTGTVEHICTKCHKSVTLQACQVQACNNYYVAAPGRKICSECLFERNTISMDDFNDRLHEERQCTHCGVPMTHLSGGNA